MKVHQCDSCKQVGPSPDGWYHLEVINTITRDQKPWDLGEFCSAACVSKATRAHEKRMAEAHAEIELADKSA